MVVALWRHSCRLHQGGHPHLARLLKALNYLVFRAILPPEALVGKNVTIGHYALGVVIHPNTTIGDGVRLWHGVTLASYSTPGDPARIVLGNDVVVGTGAVILGARHRGITIGAGSVIGANSVVTHDVPPGVVVAGAPARVIHAVGSDGIHS